MKLKVFYDNAEGIAKDTAHRVRLEVDGDFVVVGILDASYLMIADFVRECRRIHVAVNGIGFYTAKSRQGTQEVALSDVQYISGKTTPLEGRSVVLLDVVVGTGKTLQAVKRDILLFQKAKSVFCGAVFVADDEVVKSMLDNLAMKVPLNRYLVGYGLDLNGRFRDFETVYDLVDESEPDKVEFV